LLSDIHNLPSKGRIQQPNSGLVTQYLTKNLIEYTTISSIRQQQKFKFLFMDRTVDEKAEFAVRLRQALIDAGFEPRPGVLEKGFNSRYWGRSITFQAVSRWLKGEAIPSQDKLQAMVEC
jgi:hypothetical protein